jgi:hypothetical protein
MSDAAEKQPELPPPTLTSLVSMLATEAMASLGQIARPGSEPQTDFDQAKHFIDLLGMLEAKTAGNRTPDESQLLEGMVAQLRIMFVQLRK